MKKLKDPCEDCFVNSSCSKTECNESLCYQELMEYQRTGLDPEDVRKLAAKNRKSAERLTIHRRCKWLFALCVATYALGAFGKLVSMPTGMFLWPLGIMVLAWLGMVLTDD